MLISPFATSSYGALARFDIIKFPFSTMKKIFLQPSLRQFNYSFLPLVILRTMIYVRLSRHFLMWRVLALSRNKAAKYFVLQVPGHDHTFHNLDTNLVDMHAINVIAIKTIMVFWILNFSDNCVSFDYCVKIKM